MTTTVIVSGSNGFIAQHVVDALIKDGYKVIGTVRSVEKGEAMKKNFNKNFDYEILKDLGVDGAFDELLKKHKEAKYFLHTASPFAFDVQDIEKDLLLPAVDGVKDLFNSIHKYAKNIEKVVLTSSLAANANVLDEKTPVSETTWNSITWEESKANGMLGYTASKKFAEKAAWDFMETVKPSFALTTVNPTYVFGPQQFQSEVRDKLNLSNEFINSILKLSPDGELPPLGWTSVDVRDVAKAHVVALDNKDTTGERLILSNEKLTTQEVLDIIHKHFPQFNIPKGTPGVYQTSGAPIEDTLTRKLLGFKYIPFDKTIIDLVDQVVEYRKEHSN